MNANFNVQLSAEVAFPGDLTFLNNSIRHVSARMAWKKYRPKVQDMDYVTSSEGFRLRLGAAVLGTGDTNTSRVLLNNILAFEELVALRPKLQGLMTVSLFGESKSFSIQEFTILAINAEQDSSYTEFEVRAVLAQP